MNPRVDGRNAGAASDVASSASLESTRAYLFLGATCGLMTGAASLAVLGFRRYFSGLIFYPLETVWREPLAAVFFMTATAAILAIGRRVWPRLFRWRVLLGLGVFGGSLTALLRITSLHAVASVVLSAGIAYQCTRWSVYHSVAVGRLVRAAPVPGLAAIVLAAALLPTVRLWRDYRALGPVDASGGEAPNVLLVVLDTVRAWSLSAYGYPRPTSPVLTELASRGVLFTRAMSPAPWTLPAHASLFTGRWPHELSTDWTWPLDGTYPTIAELLAARGYLTGGFCANVRYCSYETGLARGFAHYEDYDVPIREALNAGPVMLLNGHIQRLLGTPLDEDEEGKSRTAPKIAKAFLSWLDRSRGSQTGQPFFAFLNFFDAHRPYSSPDEFHARFSTPGAPFTPNLLPRSGPRRPWNAALLRGSQDAYDAAIAFLDSELGQLVGELDRRGLLANTIIIVTSDHGEEFGEHGMIGHGNSLYRAALMVPLVIVAPGRTPAGLRVETPVSTRDVPHTVLELIAHGGGAQIPGRSLTRFWHESSTPAGDPVLVTLRYGPRLPEWYPVSNGPVRSIIDGDWCYIVQEDGTEELFDFDRDVLEQHNLVTTELGKQIGPRLRALLVSLTRNPS